MLSSECAASVKKAGGTAADTGYTGTAGPFTGTVAINQMSTERCGMSHGRATMPARQPWGREAAWPGGMRRKNEYLDIPVQK